MIIRSAEFLTSAVRMDQCPQDRFPEMACLGRSNVGKSSLINKLLNRRHLARTSAQPGKTQTINYYLINGEMYLVDLPGYGYAKVSKDLKATWAPMIYSYLERRESLGLILQLVDLRHAPSKLDKEMNSWLQDSGRAFAVVATKADKLSRSARAKNAKVIRDDLDLRKSVPLFVTSADSGEGLEPLWEHIEQRLFTMDSQG